MIDDELDIKNVFRIYVMQLLYSLQTSEKWKIHPHYNEISATFPILTIGFKRMLQTRDLLKQISNQKNSDRWRKLLVISMRRFRTQNVFHNNVIWNLIKQQLPHSDKDISCQAK